MKKFYAEKATWGADQTTIIAFVSRKERDEYVSTTDYSNAVSATSSVRASAISLNEYNNYYN